MMVMGLVERLKDGLMVGPYYGVSPDWVKMDGRLSVETGDGDA